MEKTELDLTRGVLKPGFREDRLARGFAIHPKDKKEEECVMILGLNPAGDEKDAERERKIQSLCYVPKLEGDLSAVMKRCHYPRYFKPIYDLVQETISKDVMVKWSWCNIPQQELEEQLPNIEGITEEQKGKILDFYQKANAKEEGNLTIYTGDMFYYHETQSGKLKELLVDNFDNSYYRKMLKWHIETLKEHKKTIKYIYINNALVSHGLTDGGDNAGASMISVEGVPVFTGCMLSGGRAMDVFSKTRLIKEIKNEL